MGASLEALFLLPAAPSPTARRAGLRCPLDWARGLPCLVRSHTILTLLQRCSLGGTRSSEPALRADDGRRRVLGGPARLTPSPVVWLQSTCCIRETPIRKPVKQMCCIDGPARSFCQTPTKQTPLSVQRQCSMAEISQVTSTRWGTSSPSAAWHSWADGRTCLLSLAHAACPMGFAALCRYICEGCQDGGRRV